MLNFPLFGNGQNITNLSSIYTTNQPVQTPTATAFVTNTYFVISSTYAATVNAVTPGSAVLVTNITAASVTISPVQTNAAITTRTP